MKFSLHALTSQNSALHCQTLWNGRHRCSSVEGLMAASLGSTTKCDHIWGWVKTYYRTGLMWCCTSINQSILGYDAIVLTHSHVNIGMNMIVYNMYIYIYSYCYRYIEIYVCDSICISEYRSANMIVFSLHERLIQNEKIHLRRCFTATAPRFLSPSGWSSPFYGSIFRGHGCHCAILSAQGWRWSRCFNLHSRPTRSCQPFERSGLWHQLPSSNGGPKWAIVEGKNDDNL